MISPCIKQCRLDIDRQYCVACGRTVQQIVDWRSYTDKQREEIIKNLSLKQKAI